MDESNEEVIEEVTVSTEGEQQEPEAPTGEQQTDEDEEEVTVSIGNQAESETEDEEDETMAPPWVKELRLKYKETAKKNFELKQKLQELETKAVAPAPQAVDPGPKPTLESCDYDSDEFDAKLANWYETKAKAEAVKSRMKAEEEQAAKEFETHIHRYEGAKKKLRVKDFDLAELAVAEALSIQQRQILLEIADKPELVVYALGKNPAKLAELASVKKSVLFSKGITKLEGQLKVGTKKKKLTPESKVRGSAALSGVVDGTLEKLRAEAERTGDYTKVHKYRREKKLKA